MTKKFKKSNFVAFLTTITPFSRGLAFLLFIILPILAFYLGRYYEKNILLTNNYLSQNLNNKLSKTVIINFSDNNKTLFLKRGDKLVFNLSKNFNWLFKINSSNNLKKISENKYLILKSGKTMFQAFGKPICARGEFCSQLIINFTVAIKVK